MEGYVSDGFKTASVNPHIKKFSHPANDLKNYCPVSGLNFISKLVERVVVKQLLEHIQVQNLDSPGHPTETALLHKNKVHLSVKQTYCLVIV